MGATEKGGVTMLVSVGSILLWYTFNISTLLLNKYIFQIIDFHLPLSLTLVHMCYCSLGATLVLRVFKLMPFEPVDNASYKKKIIPLAIIFCVNIILGNISLNFVPISFMQTIKSSVPAFTVLILSQVMHQQFSFETYISLVPVVGGIGLASYTELSFDMLGFIAALTASVVTALQSIISGILLGGKKMDPVTLIYYMAPLSALMILPFAFVFEYEELLVWPYMGTSLAAMILSLSGIVAFALNCSTFLAIKNSSPLTFTVAGNFKVVLSITISVLIFKNPVTILNGVGCGIAIIGVMWYNKLRYQANMAEKRRREKEESPSDMENNK